MSWPEADIFSLFSSPSRGQSVGLMDMAADRQESDRVTGRTPAKHIFFIHLE